MKTLLTTAAAALTFALPAYAEGDAAAGAKEFRKCKACHAIVSPDGEAILKGGRVGPNLYGIIGSPAGAVEGFNYGSATVAAGEKGLVWDVEQLEAYLPNPTQFLKDYLGDSGAKSKMAAQRVKSVADIAAYLASTSE